MSEVVTLAGLARFLSLGLKTGRKFGAGAKTSLVVRYDDDAVLWDRVGLLLHRLPHAIHGFGSHRRSHC